MIAQAPSVPMLMYRKDILEKYGVAEPPEDGWSWDELRENATTVHAGLQADGETDVYGLLFGGKPSAAALIPMMAIWSYGQELFDENFNPLFDSPKAIEAVQVLYDLVHKDKIVSPGMPGYEYPEILVALQEGKAAIAIQWDSAVQTLNNPEASPLTGGNMGYSFFPWEKSVGPDHARIFPAIDGLVIPTSSTQKEAAFEYIAWFTSQENGKDMLINGGGNSGRASLLTDPDVLAAHSSYPAEAKTAALYHQLPDLASLLFIVFGILNPNWNGMFSGQTTPEEANKKINEEIIAHLKEEGVLS